MNIKYRIISCIICVAMLLLLQSCKMFHSSTTVEKDRETKETVDLFDDNGIVDFTNIDYRRTTDSLNETFKALDGTIVDGFWKYYEWGSTFIGPSNYIVCGFLKVTSDKAEEIESKFSLEKASVDFPKGIIPEDTGYSDFDWGYSSDFDKWIEGGSWIGDAYYDSNNKIIYVYVAVK